MTCLDDATVLGLVEGRLAAATLADIDEHLDGCASCRDVVTLVAGGRGSSRVLARGDTVGRYVIGDLLGSGAMGRVYSAWEPELDRRVAIKVLIDEGGAARERLVREAQAMAKLSHPNVVTVHEVGTTDAGVFVAMELVDGETLRAWVADRRPWREVVRVLIEIARGLAAVHATGVIHRDIKPDNVIIGADGRVRLGDFGLARAGVKDQAPTLAVGTDTTVAGTPAYMAPEVLRGGSATPASDQFSVGVLAYELLAGKRPFSGTTWSELLSSIERNDIAALRNVPGWLDATVRRCLAVDPAKRFGPMQALVDALEHHSRARSMRWVAAAVAAAAVASVGTYALVHDRSRPAAAAACSLDAAVPLHAAIAKRKFDAPIRTALDRWVATWSTEHLETCRAAAAAPDARVAARERCLDERRTEIEGFIAALPRKSIAWSRLMSSSPSALDALASLPSPVDCRTAADAEEAPLPLDPARAEPLRILRETLPRLRAVVAAGDARIAMAATGKLVTTARKLDHAPTLAAALLLDAEAVRAHPDMIGVAADEAREALAEAVRGRADMLAARAWLLRIAIAGEQRQLDAAEDLGVVAQAAVERAGSPPYLAASLLRMRGLIAYNRGRYDDAMVNLSRAREQFVALSGEHSLDVASIDSGIGSIARAVNGLDEAERRHRAALAVDRELRGEQSSAVARDHHNIAGVLRLRGDLDGALTEYRAALAIETALQGENSVPAGLTHNSLGLVDMARKDWPAARTELTLARDILTAANHGDRAFAEHNLGLVAQALGDHRVALARFDAAAAVYKTTIGDRAPAALRLVDDRAVSTDALKRGAVASSVEKPTKQPSVMPAAQSPGTPVEALRDAPPHVARESSSPPADASKTPAPITITPPPPVPAPPPPSATKPKDVGVYGSSQSW